MTTPSALVAAAVLVVIALVVGAGLLDDLVRVVRGSRSRSSAFSPGTAARGDADSDVMLKQGENRMSARSTHRRALYFGARGRGFLAVALSTGSLGNGRCFGRATTDTL